MQAPRLVRSVIARNIVRRNYTETHQVTTLNDLPSPQGNWKTHNDARQRRYNAQLAIGAGVLVGTVLVGKAGGLLEFHNDMPVPIDIPSYK
jgi:hypothetical protein